MQTEYIFHQQWKDKEQQPTILRQKKRTRSIEDITRTRELQSSQVEEMHKVDAKGCCILY